LFSFNPSFKSFNFNLEVAIYLFVPKYSEAGIYFILEKSLDLSKVKCDISKLYSSIYFFKVSELLP